MRKSFYKDEAIKTLKVGKLLSLSFANEEEIIINKLMELEQKERAAHASNYLCFTIFLKFHKEKVLKLVDLKFTCYHV